MLLVGTAQGNAGTRGQVARGQQAVGLDHPTLGMHPLGLDGIEPGAVAGQRAGEEAHAGACSPHLAGVLPQPGVDLSTDVPAGVVPHQQERRLALGSQAVAAPGQELGGAGTDRAAIDEAQPDLVDGGQEQAIAGQRLGVGIILRDRLFDQPQGLARLSPGVQGRPCQAAPPRLVLKAEGPVRVGGRPADQAVAAPFFLGRQS